MQRERSVIHLNVADFAVAVERVVDRTLSRRPVIIAPAHAVRAFVYDMSDEAYDEGVRKGMPLVQAVRQCRSALVLPPRPDRYRQAMMTLASKAREYAPHLEYGAEDGHLFLDITGTHRLFGAAADVGLRLRRQLRDGLGLDPIWSLAGNKLVAKVASRLVKPVGEFIVGNGEEEQFLAPLPLSLLPGLVDRELQRLHDFNVRRIGQLVALGGTTLQTVFGARGNRLFEMSRGIDNEPVWQEKREVPSVDLEHVFAGDVGEQAVVVAAVDGLAVRLGVALRSADLVARRLILQLQYTDGSRVNRQVSVRPGVADDTLLRRMARTVLARAWGRRIRVRGCRLRGDRLHRRSPQLRLFADPSGGERRDQLSRALDTVRHRFGEHAVRFGSQLVI